MITFTPQGLPMCCTFVLSRSGYCTECYRKYDLAEVQHLWEIKRRHSEALDEEHK